MHSDSHTLHTHTLHTPTLFTQPLPAATKTSPFPPPPDDIFPSAPEEIELDKKDFDLHLLDTSNLHSLSVREFPRSDLLLLDKLGEGEYGPIYRYSIAILHPKSFLYEYILYKPCKNKRHESYNYIFDCMVEVMV